MNKNSKTAFYPLPKATDIPATVVLSNGNYPSDGTLARAMLERCGRVVCCDGAADAFIANGGIPAAIVGDCDSLSDTVKKQYCERLMHIADQASNDQTKAVRYCLSQGWNDIVILGATGKREDHTLGNISLLCDYMRNAHVSMITDYGIFNAFNSRSEFETYNGQQLSLFTITPYARVTATNVVYGLPAKGFGAWWQGTLNEATADKIEVFTDDFTLIFREF